MADRALCEPQLTGRARHAAMAQRRIERNQAIKRGKSAHAGTMNDIHGDVNNWRWQKAAIQDTSKAFSSEACPRT